MLIVKVSRPHWKLLEKANSIDKYPDFEFYKADTKVKCSLWHHHTQNASIPQAGPCLFLL